MKRYWPSGLAAALGSPLGQAAFGKIAAGDG